MAPEVLAALGGLLVLLLLVALGAVLVVRTNRSGEAEAAGARDGGAAAVRAPGQGRMGRAGLRQRRRARQDEDDDEGGGGAGSSGDEEPDYENMTRAERRAAEREARRGDRDEARQAAQEAQEARDAKRQAYDGRRRQKDEEREAAEEAALQELQRAEQERLRREEEEAAKWLHLIDVEGEGQDAEDEDEGEGLLSQFVSYIKGAKAVELDELAAEFRLPTAEAIRRIQSLEAQGDLTGVMDDRGKFIYISREEMQAVATFVTQRGRVSIAELAAKSNTFIDLDTKRVERAAGEEQSRSAADLDLGLDEE